MFRVTIEKQDILCGIERSSRMCPIARALNRQFPAFGQWQVSLDKISRIERDANGVISTVEKYRLGWRARRFIRRFDAHRRVRGFTFKFDR